MRQDSVRSLPVQGLGNRPANETRLAPSVRSGPGTRSASAPPRRRAPVSRLVAVSQAIGLEVEASPRGRWIRFRSAQGPIYVSEAMFGQGYYTWDDAEHPEAVGPYIDPHEAIRAGLQRVAQRRTDTTRGG